MGIRLQRKGIIDACPANSSPSIVIPNPVEHDPVDPNRARTATRPRSPSVRRRQEFFTVAELAERWNLSERHIRREIDAGALQAHYFGKAVRISLANALKYEAARQGGL